MTRQSVVMMIVVGSLVAACGSTEPLGLAETGAGTAVEPVSAAASESDSSSAVSEGWSPGLGLRHRYVRLRR